MYLLDTNVVSELVRRVPNLKIAARLQATPSSILSRGMSGTSTAFSISELKTGSIELAPAHPPSQCSRHVIRARFKS